MPAPKRCTKCVYHGDLTPHAVEQCPRVDCACRKCVLLEERRELLAKLNNDKAATVKAAEDKPDNSRYTCSKCRRHGIVVPKKFHEPCPFTLCQCETCELTVRKGVIDRELAAMVREDKNGDGSPLSFLVDPSVYMVPPAVDPAFSPETQVILDLLTLLTHDENNVNVDGIDFDALKIMLNQPNLYLPEQWMPHMGVITELVFLAMKRLPCFRDFEFERCAV